jgi:putative hemolysin
MPLVFFLAVALALASSFVCSISEAVLLSVSHAQIEALGKSRAADLLRRYKREIDLPIAAILTLNTTAHTIGASVAGAYYGDVFDPKTLWVFSALFTLAILIFSEIIPKTLAVASAGTLATPVAYGVAGLVVVLKPLLHVTRAIARSLRPAGSQPVTSLEEIRLLASLGRTEGVVGQLAADMIEGVATLKELRARDVMVPRARVVYLSGLRTFEENLEVIRRTGHSRFPYTPTGDLDRVEGVVLVKDLMFTLREVGEDIDLEELASKALVVPSATTLERLLRMFQQERRHLAIVVDEYGGTEGIVTLEDVLEEIVGEIEDESDRVDPFVTKRSDGSLVCRGWAEARAVLGGLGVEADDVEAVTVGGLVAELVGRVPRVGDCTEWRGLQFVVLQASPRRAERVEIRKIPEAMNSKPEAE